MEYIILSILILFFGAVFSLFIKEKFKLKVCSIFTLIANATAIFPAVYVLFNGAPLDTNIVLSPIMGSINLQIDTLTAIFIIIIYIRIEI